jgi:bifunctional non-homologous end joining protein LigD
MDLDPYNKKRNFTITPEPRGRVREPRTIGLSFVVQKHAARNLHYDFRLEFDGVLLSWTVPKGPSLDPDVRRSAIRTENHPLEYAEFEGIIPKKEYGGGTVMIWDRGTWKPIEDPKAGLKRGRLRFLLFGEKLSGRWSLVRDWSNEEREVWWLIKAEDQAARKGEAAEVVALLPDSVTSGRTIEEISEDKERVWHSDGGEVSTATAKTKRKSGVPASRIEGAKKLQLPEMIGPTLATSVKEAPEGDAWLHEIKYDGYRMLCRIRDGEACFFSRKQQDWTRTFSSLSRTMAGLPVKSAWLDGEVVVLENNGCSSFQALQKSLSGQQERAVGLCGVRSSLS